MKTISKILTLLLVTLVFASCGSSEDGPQPVLKFKTIDYVYSAPIKGLKGIKGEYELPALTLQQILGDTIPVKNFVRAEFTPVTSYLKVSGLTGIQTQPRLNGTTIKLANNPILTLGNISPIAAADVNWLSDKPLQDITHVDWIKSVFTSLIGSQKKANMILSFTPSEDILESNNVTFNVVISATYYYNVYPTN